jgi:hypothetical protein
MPASNLSLWYVLPCQPSLIHFHPAPTPQATKLSGMKLVVFCTTDASCAAAWAVGIPALRNRFTTALHKDDQHTQSALKLKWLIAHLATSLGYRTIYLDADIGIASDFSKQIRVAGATADLLLYWDVRFDNIGAAECEQLPGAEVNAGQVPDMLSTAIMSLAPGNKSADLAKWMFDRLARMTNEQERGVLKQALLEEQLGVQLGVLQWPEFTETVDYEVLVELDCAEEAEVLALHCGHVYDEANKPGVLALWDLYNPAAYEPVTILNLGGAAGAAAGK